MALSGEGFLPFKGEKMKKSNKRLWLAALCVAVLPLTAFTACNAEDPVGLDSTSGILDPGDMMSGMSGTSDMSGAGASVADSGSGEQPGSADIEPEQKYTVTENEWKAAFNKSAFENATVAYTATRDGDVITIVLKSDKTENAYSMFITDVSDGKTNTFEAVAAKSGDKYYGYSKTAENEWQKGELSETEFSAAYDNVFKDYLVLSVFENRFDNFAYDEDEKLYKVTDLEIDGATCSSTVALVDGKVSALTINAKSSDETFDYSVAVTDYGKTTVDVPEVNDNDGESSESASA